MSVGDRPFLSLSLSLSLSVSVDAHVGRQNQKFGGPRSSTFRFGSRSTTKKLSIDEPPPPPPPPSLRRKFSTKVFSRCFPTKKINKERNPRPWNSSDRREPRVSLRHGMATQNFAFKEVEEEEQEEEESAYSSGKSRANFAVDSGRDFQTLPLPLAQLGAPQFDIRFQFQVE